MPDLKTRFRGAERIAAPNLWPDITSREPRPQAHEPSLPRRALVATLALAVAVAGVAFAIRAFEGPRDRRQPITPAPGSVDGVIAYASIGQQQMFWTINPDGSDPTRVHVDVPGFVRVPSWSPDGTRIAFDVNSDDEPHPKGGNFDIYVANADGTDPVRLTFEKVDHNPAWSPDGTQIAYVRGWEDQAQIWVMNADGSDPHPLTDASGPNLFPSWSPDGATIAFVSFDGSNSDIYAMNTDGSDVRRLTDDPAHEDQPAWSPDGRHIAFTREGAGNPGIYVMSPDGSGVTQLLHDADPANLGLAWSPDGTKMAVVSIRDPGYDRTLFVLELATGELTAIGGPGAFFGPSWQPVPASSSSPTPSQPTPTVPTEPNVTPVTFAPRVKTTVADTIEVGRPPGSVTAVLSAFGSIWVTGYTGDQPQQYYLLRIDPATDEIVARIAIDTVPAHEVGGGGLAAGDGSVWIAGSGPSDEGGNGQAVVERIDPSTNSVVDRIDLGGAFASDVSVDSTGAWVAMFGPTPTSTQVVRIDPPSGTVMATIPLPSEFVAEIFAMDGAVLVQQHETHGSVVGDAFVSQIDPSTNQIVARLDLNVSLGSADGDLWATSGGEILKLDPQTGSVAEAWSSAHTGNVVRPSQDGIWMLSLSGQSALRFIPADALIDASVELHQDLVDLAVSPGAIWVLTYDGMLIRVNLGG
jgi:Tol biopolymer transport system component